MCGEKPDAPSPGTRGTGSPPRVRGKVNTRRISEPVLRITPACAGKSPTCFRSRSNWWDHPRVCGEKHTLSYSQFSPLGSPPRVRGKDLHSSLLRFASRITPACAGKRTKRGCNSYSQRDHPRVCGEKATFPLFLVTVVGSPPRVRGKVENSPAAGVCVRITPACAGKRDNGKRASIPR